jgi:hypothetical protein
MVVTRLTPASNSSVDREGIRADSKAALNNVLDSTPFELKINDLVGILDSFRPNIDLAAISAGLNQVFLQHLRFGAHDCTHCRLDFSNDIEISRTVAVDHHELQVLRLLEEVVHANASLEVWIKIVHDLLCLADHHPLVVDFFVNHALWIGFAESVEVFQISPRNG